MKTHKLSNEARQYHRDYYHRVRKPQLEKTELKKIMVRISLPNTLVGRLQRIVNEGIATGIYPWKSMSAAMNALIVRGMESMKGDPDMESMLKYLRGMGQLEGMAQHRTEAQAAFNRAKVEISEMLAIKAEQDAVRYFHNLRRTFEEMDTHIWQQWLLRQLDQTFPKLLRQKPKPISLDEHAETDEPWRKVKPRKKGVARG